MKKINIATTPVDVFNEVKELTLCDTEEGEYKIRRTTSRKGKKVTVETAFVFPRTEDESEGWRGGEEEYPKVVKTISLFDDAEERNQAKRLSKGWRKLTDQLHELRALANAYLQFKCDNRASGATVDMFYAELLEDYKTRFLDNDGSNSTQWQESQKWLPWLEYLNSLRHNLLKKATSAEEKKEKPPFTVDICEAHLLLLHKQKENIIDAIDEILDEHVDGNDRITVEIRGRLNGLRDIISDRLDDCLRKLDIMWLMEANKISPLKNIPYMHKFTVDQEQIIPVADMAKASLKTFSKLLNEYSIVSAYDADKLLKDATEKAGDIKSFFPLLDNVLEHLCRKHELRSIISEARFTPGRAKS